MDPDLEKKLVDKIYQMSSGYARTQELYTTIKLGIPDLLAGGAMGLPEIARELKVDQQGLLRFLRLLVTREILVEENNKYRLAPLGEILRSDHPSLAHNIMLYIGEIQYRVGGEMLYSVQTGKPAFDKIFGMPFFDYLSANPETGTWFNDGMKFSTDARMRGMVASYPFNQANFIVDVGGGNATLVIHILQNNPHPAGIVFEVASVAAEARQNIEGNHLADRCRVVEGNFFVDPLPAGCDLYILSNIIHDWLDEPARRILTNCCAAMHHHSRLLLVEQIMPEKVDPGSAVVGSDVSMLLLTGGRERTRVEYDALLGASGLEISNIIPFEPSNAPAGRKPTWAIIETRQIKKGS
jgi:hypothetical protein